MSTIVEMKIGFDLSKPGQLILMKRISDLIQESVSAEAPTLSAGPNTETPSFNTETPEPAKKPAKKTAKKINPQVDPDQAELEMNTARNSEPVTIGILRALVQVKVAKNREGIKSKLTELGAANVSSLKEENYQSMFNFLSDLKNDESES